MSADQRDQPGHHESADGDLQDRFTPKAVLAHETVYSGLVWDVVRDTVDLGEAGVVKREYVQHTGAVAILALDDDGQVFMIEQYRVRPADAVPGHRDDGGAEAHRLR